MDTFWQGRRVLVTGASGFIGSHVAELLVRRGATVTAAIPRIKDHSSVDNLASVRSKVACVETDLTELDDCLAACNHQDVVISIAHVDGSAAFKQARPSYIFRQNMLITLQMIEAACRQDVERFLVMSSAEVYAPEATAPTPETMGFSGMPSSVSASYAWSKRMSEFAAQVAAREHGLRVAIARPSNVYGPRDHFDAQKGRVIPMFIKQAFEGSGSIRIWGSGQQVRAFLYVEDLARGLLALVERYAVSEPVNFSSQEAITIKGLAELIVSLSGRNVTIDCDPAGPSGAQVRTLDTCLAERELGFRSTVPLEVGLQRTIDAYLESRVPDATGA